MKIASATESAKARREAVPSEPLTMGVEEWPSPPEVHAIKQVLNRYNRERMGEDDHQHLAVVLRDSGNHIVGGLWGETYWDWLYVDVLAVHERARGQGWGTRLLAAAEAEAIARGCHYAHLDTFDFQALPFYEKRGYEIFGTLDHFPGEHKRYFLKKELKQKA